jgi:hypothetical protein
MIIDLVFNPSFHILKEWIGGINLVVKSDLRSCNSPGETTLQISE